MSKIRPVGKTSSTNVIVGATQYNPNNFRLLVDVGRGNDTSNLHLPIQGTGMTIDWGDGTVDEGVDQLAVPSDTNKVSHNYGGPCTRVVQIGGGLHRILYSGRPIDWRMKIIDHHRWGNIEWSTMSGAFRGLGLMVGTFNDVPNLTNVSSLEAMYQECRVFEGDLMNWDVSTITDLYMMFYLALRFNSDISGWTFNNLERMYRVFDYAYNFNSDISGWATGNVEDFRYFARRAIDFNRNLGSMPITSMTIFNHAFQHTQEMSTENYTDTIVGWANQAFNNAGLPANVNGLHQDKTFDSSRSGGVNFANAGDARAYLDSLGWNIGDTVI